MVDCNVSEDSQTVYCIYDILLLFFFIYRKASSSEVKSRTRRLHDLFRSYRTYDGRVGCEVRVLITEPSFDGKFWVGHTKAYEQVCVNY